MQMFTGIMAPLIPIFIGTGLFQALIGILSSDMAGNLMPTITGNILDTAEYGVGWALLHAVGKSSIIFMGIVIAYNAGNYFNLNRPISVGIGIIMSSPLLFGTGGPALMGN